MSLTDYERTKFALADLVWRIGAIRGRPAHQDAAVQDLMVQLAEDRFVVAVVGRFSRGKSSLMNAVLGGDWLPTGLLPHTSVVTAVRYGSQPAVWLTHKGALLKQRAELAQLADFVTETGNPANRRQIELAEIQLPASLLRRGVWFVDTPGLGSTVRENARTTEAFLPRIDAFVLVTSFEGPLSSEEVGLVEEARRTGRRLFVIVNKQDLVAPQERQGVVDYVRRAIAAALGEPDARIFPVSAKEALKAKLEGDVAAVSASGLAAFESALVEYLLEEKQSDFLRAFVARTASLIDELPSQQVKSELRAELAGISRQAGAANDLLTLRLPAAAETASNDTAACPICFAVDKALFAFLAQFQYDVTVNVQRRRSLADAGGLCRLHTWTYHNMASPLGIAVGFPDVLDAWSRRLEATARGDGAQDPILAEPDVVPGSCAVCASVTAAETAAIDALARDDRSSPPSLCLPHLRLLLQQLPDEEARERWLLREAALFTHVAEDLRRYALKFDAMRRVLASEGEESAPLRALRLLAGLPNLSYVRRGDIFI